MEEHGIKGFGAFLGSMVYNFGMTLWLKYYLSFENTAVSSADAGDAARVDRLASSRRG